MVDIDRLRGLGKDTIIDMIDNPPDFTKKPLELELFIELMIVYLRYCHQPSTVFTYNEKVNNPRLHLGDFIEWLFR